MHFIETIHFFHTLTFGIVKALARAINRIGAKLIKPYFVPGADVKRLSSLELEHEIAP